MDPISVVVADDHPVVREGLISLLRHKGMAVVGDCGATKGIASLVQNYRPDVLLLDIHMEVLTFPIVRKLRTLFSELKVLFITAFASPGNIQKAKMYGGHGLIDKTQSPDKICEAVLCIAGGGQYFFEPAVQPREIKKVGKTMAHHPLSPREVEVLVMVAQAMTAKEIAKDLDISVKTVDRHKANMMNKLSVRSQIELARYAIGHGFVSV